MASHAMNEGETGPGPAAQAGFDVVVVGNAGVDTQVYLAGGEIDSGVEGHFTENLDCAGQAGVYASRGYARLGQRTAFIGCLGEDWAGQFVRAELQQEGVDVRGLFLDPTGTARSVNFMYPDGRRRNFYDGKGHMGVQPDLAQCQHLLRGARLAHFHIPDWARRLLPVARELGVPIACDIQDVMRANDRYRRDFIQAADFLFFSAVNHPDPAPLMRRFLASNPRQVIVCGMGARGCALATQAGIRFFEAVELPIPVVDTNGAGDSLAVGFLVGHVLEGRPLEDSIHRGQIVARHACTLRGTSAGLITAQELERWSGEW